ncbi:oleate hydratase [Acinetobacter rudis]|uniref:Oleate hydratase n=1 Tax=Acinetobacter rudis TaxID=632955 RepID=A0AAW8J8P5_9GAMM|nr:oleate hydratase [Acinetobacter rudis]MDQ8935550.1 oleate hydratase [Acinetobacter rudis]MDQ8953310.1 oleate hydratase [Acinetobacter rudis]MDQ9017813.1 oleate hydratase [Acinetobacter rudis]
MQNIKVKNYDAQNAHLWIIGGGIAGMAAAAFAIRDAKVPPENIHILEELNLTGGAMDGAHSPNAKHAWVTRGGRMLTDETYLCLWDLFSSIPSLENPDISVREECLQFNQHIKTHAQARLIDADHQILDAEKLGFNTLHRAQILRLLTSKEDKIGSRRIDEYFDHSFFQTNFWRMWRTTFAFQQWHSAIELRRYFLRFMQELPRIHTLAGIKRTKYNQYDSMIVPLQRWLTQQGVDVRFAHYVSDADFETNPDTQERRATRLHVHHSGAIEQIELGAQDIALFTLGSITADSRYAGNNDVPALIRDRLDHGWTLWQTLADKATDFGRPMSFYGNIDEHKWESFTLTMSDDVLLNRIIEYTGNQPGTGALMTWYQSAWHLSIVVPAQPHFADLPKNTYTLWGYGFQIDQIGDYIKKPMSEATGTEILTELVKQLGFDDILTHVLSTTQVTTAMMPYASALFACRKPGDRPQVVPKNSGNFAFLGQFVELKDDVVFTVEYSVRGAMTAIYHFFEVDHEIPDIYNGLFDPKVGLKALETVFH